MAAASSPAIEEPGGLAEWIASLAAQEKAAEQRRRKAEARKAAAEAAVYAKRLDQLAARTEEAWREGGSAEFMQRFGELRARHDRKPSLQERFDKAGLPS